MILSVQMIASLFARGEVEEDTAKVRNSKTNRNGAIGLKLFVKLALVRVVLYMAGIMVYALILDRFAHRSLFEMGNMGHFIIGAAILVVTGFASDWLKKCNSKVLICQIGRLLVGFFGAVVVFMSVAPSVELLVLEIPYLKAVLMIIAVVTGNGLVKAVLEDASLSRPTDGSNLGRKIGYIERFVCVMGIWVAEINLILAFIALKTLARHKLMDDVKFSEIYLLGTSVSMTYAIVFGYVIRNLEYILNYMIIALVG